MKTSLKAGFAQIFSCFPKNLSCPKFGGGPAVPLAPPRPVRLCLCFPLSSATIVSRGLIQLSRAK